MTTVFELFFWISLFAIFYSYAGYPAVVSLLARLFGRENVRDESRLPSVAVIIPACNEERVIRDKIANTLSLSYPPELLTVWVGSDRSTDSTDDIVRGFADPRVRLWVAPRRGGKTSIINALAAEADAEIIVVTDADIMLESGSVRALARHYADPRVGGACGNTEHVTTAAGGGGEEKAYRSLESFLKDRESRLHSTVSAFGSFFSFRKSLFSPLPRNAYSNDDVVIPLSIVRKKYRVVFDPSSRSFERVTPDMKTEFVRRVRIGAGNFQAFFWFLDFLNPLKGWPWFCYISHKATRWFSPFFILVAALSCALLAFADGSAVYAAFFWAGLCLAAVALLYPVLPVGPVRPLYYFLSMNAALLLGFFRYVAGIRSAAWSRTERG